MFGKIDIEDLSCYSDDHDDIYLLLQEWITWNARRGVTASSIKCYFNAFRSYLWYHKIKLDTKDIRQNLKFPRTLYETEIPITIRDIKKILIASKPEFRFHLLALVSSGMRVNELGKIRIEHLDLSHSNIMVKIPAYITKIGRSRITFFSKQVSDMIRYRINTKQIDDYVFSKYRTPAQFCDLVGKRFAATRKITNMLEKYGHCKQNRYTIHIHSMRSYFITVANKIQFGLGHILAGHDFYMKQYNRYTIDELLDMYKQFEISVTFHKTYYSK